MLPVGVDLDYYDTEWFALEMNRDHSGVFEIASAVATGLEKVSFHSDPKERQCQSAQTTTQLHSSHTLVMFKILQARLHP